jgi:hypothetical protein
LMRAVMETRFYSAAIAHRHLARSLHEQNVEVTVRIVGIALMVLGIIALLYGGITYTKREKVLDIGPIEATAKTRETIPLSPVFGAVAIVSGIALFVVAGKGRR